MKIVVTGGGGYIASALLPVLLREFPTASIIFLDNLSQGDFSHIKKYRKRCKFLKADVCNFNFNSLSLRKGDSLIHLAALSYPSDSYSRRKEFKAINYTAALRIAKFCARSGVFLFFPSTTSIYTGKNGKLLKSRIRKILPQTPYAALKYKTEVQMRGINNLRYTIARFATVYGFTSKMNFQTVINRFCRQAKRGEALSVWETAQNQYRPYLYLGDAVRFIVESLKNPKLTGKTCNVVSENRNLKEIVRMLQAANPSVQIRLQTSPAMNTLSYRVRSYESQRFRPTGSIKKGVRELLRGILK